MQTSRTKMSELGPLLVRGMAPWYWGWSEACGVHAIGRIEYLHLNIFCVGISAKEVDRETRQHSLRTSPDDWRG